MNHQQYGTTLPDQFDRISSNFDTHLEVVEEIREVYREKALLDREYSNRLQTLAKKAAEKKARLESTLVLGDEPTKQWAPSVLKDNTLNASYDEFIKSISSAAQDYSNFADSLSSQTIESLKALERWCSDTKKRELQFFQKLLSERDRTYNERQKCKAKYDAECTEVEAYRQKQNRSQDGRHADRVAKQAEQQRNEMLNAKNLYILSIAAANKAKEKFYGQDLVDLENQFQIFQTQLTDRFARILSQAQALESAHLDVLKGRLQVVEHSLSQTDAAKDQDLFIDYNIRPFEPPADWKFEPCQFFYDTDSMNVDPAPKIFLQNKLAKSQAKLKELLHVLQEQVTEYERLGKQVDAESSPNSIGNLGEVIELQNARHSVTYYRTSEALLRSEIDMILSAIGDDVGHQKPHAFKGSTFSIPVSCHYCKASIWGLSKQGKTCKACGISVHSKCELKVPADCGQPGDSVVSADTPPPSHSSLPASEEMKVPTASSFVPSSANEDESDYPKARVLFDFTATSEFEISVFEGLSLSVVEPDDGSGWIKVLDGQGNIGLVPATYIEYLDGVNSQTESQTSPDSHRVKAMYSYAARGSDELGLVEGELIELSSGPSGGRNYSEEWWEGINSEGQRGIFPANYVVTV